MNYADSSLFGRRRYELRENLIVVSGTTTGGSNFEAQIEYSDLNPIPERIWVRSPMVWGGLALVSMATLILIAFAVFQSQDKSFFVGFAYTIALIGLILALASLKRIEIARFKSTAGVTSLDVIRAGKQKAQFDSFVEELSARAQSWRTPNQATEPPSPRRVGSS